jgi:hypothetical protein
VAFGPEKRERERARVERGGGVVHGPKQRRKREGREKGKREGEVPPLVSRPKPKREEKEKEAGVKKKREAMPCACAQV